MDRMCDVWKASILLGVEFRDQYRWSTPTMDQMRATTRLKVLHRGVGLMAAVGSRNVVSRLYHLALKT